jgi:hypothetical protein
MTLSLAPKPRRRERPILESGCLCRPGRAGVRGITGCRKIPHASLLLEGEGTKGAPSVPKALPGPVDLWGETREKLTGLG